MVVYFFFQKYAVDGSVARIKLNRPDRLNAIAHPMPLGKTFFFGGNREGEKGEGGGEGENKRKKY